MVINIFCPKDFCIRVLDLLATHTTDTTPHPHPCVRGLLWEVDKNLTHRQRRTGTEGRPRDA